MSYATTLEYLATVLESIEGVSLANDPPYDTGFKRLDEPFDAEKLAQATSFRRFILDAGEIRSVAKLSTGREYSGSCVLTVLYPRSRSRAFVESFMESDMDLIRKSFEDSAHWQKGVRLIAYMGTDAPKHENHVTKAVHRFTIDWVEP